MRAALNKKPSTLGSLYPAGPHDVPGDLARPSRAYKRHLWLAVLALLSFVLSYVALSCWFAKVAYRAFSSGTAAGFFLGLPALVIAVFLVKGLLFVRHGAASGRIELTRQSDPLLFDFLDRLASEAAAPRPHRVYVSSGVNAAVFYDISLVNLLIPSRKNLDIGLGLLNVLTLSELKAVLAHEFGHFAQRSMAVGRWVYTAQQVAAQIVAKRDWLDSVLLWVSRLDIRIAWIGWGFRLVIWSIRSVVDGVFRIVVLAERALSREMELQADLVSVSLTGSDALIHALHRLQGADEAWDETLHILEQVNDRGKSVSDAFAIQTLVLARLRAIFDDPEIGNAPHSPGHDPRGHRVFKRGLAHPPRMWATHPMSHEREENAKKIYLQVPLDDRSAWTLLENPADLRVRVTRELFSIGQSESQVASVDDGLVAPILEERLGHTSLHRKYRGAYLGRLFARDADSTAQLCCAPGISDDLHSEWERLYPPQLALDRARWQELEEERQTLRQFRDGRLSSPGGMIHYRGRRLSRNRLGAVLLEVDQECEKARLSLLAHERRARAVHLAMASQLDGGWEPYLRSLVSLIHYGCHAEANVLDALGHFSNVLSVVTADGRVTRREQARLVKAASEVYAALKEIYQHAPGVKLPPPVAGEMGVGAFAETLGGSLELRPPTMQNIGDWIEVVGSWVQVSASSLAALRLAALRELLLSEDQVAQGFRSGQVMIDAPVCGTVPQPYTTLMPGQERERQKKLGLWDRFVVADGMGPALARFTVALSVLFLVVGFTASEQRVTVSAYNGLGTEVTIQLGHEQLQLPAYGHKELRLDGSSELAIRTSVRGDVVESFNVDADRPFTHYVYNVAGLAPLATWTVHYGQDGDPALEIGRERWTETDAKHVFEDPPESVKTKSKASTRRVLSAPPPTMAPEELLDMVPVVERARIIEAHLRFDQGKARERWQSVNDSPQ